MTGVLYMRHSKEVTKFVKEWDELLAEGVDRVDQIGFNTLATKYTTPMQTALQNDRLASGTHQLSIGVLPVRGFMNGHTYFVQRMHEASTMSYASHSNLPSHQKLSCHCKDTEKVLLRFSRCRKYTWDGHNDILRDWDWLFCCASYTEHLAERWGTENHVFPRRRVLLMSTQFMWTTMKGVSKANGIAWRKQGFGWNPQPTSKARMVLFMYSLLTTLAYCLLMDTAPAQAN